MGYMGGLRPYSIYLSGALSFCQRIDLAIPTYPKAFPKDPLNPRQTSFVFLTCSILQSLGLGF